MTTQQNEGKPLSTSIPSGAAPAEGVKRSALNRLLDRVRMPSSRTYRGGHLPRRSGGQPVRTDGFGVPIDPTPELTRDDAAAELRGEQ